MKKNDSQKHANGIFGRIGKKRAVLQASLLRKIGEHERGKKLPGKIEQFPFDLTDWEKQLIELVYKVSKEDAEFTIESIKSTLSSVTRDLQNIKEAVIQENFSRIATVGGQLKRKYESREEERLALHGALNDISNALQNLFAEIERQVGETSRIVHMPREERKKLYHEDLSLKTDGCNAAARRCMDAVIVGMTYARQIGARLGSKDADFLNDAFDRFLDGFLLSGDHCRMMDRFDPCKSEYWLIVPQGARQVIESGNAADRSNGAEEDIDWDHLDFSTD